jgi:Ca-activated chloride channel family protein
MMSTRFIAICAAFAMCPVLLAETQWVPVTEGRLEIQNADLQSPDAEVPAVVPLRHTDVQIQVRGLVAEATVTQRFENVLDRAIEAEYVFPLPHDAAVNATEMRVGERVIRGHIAKRDEARRAYEDAKAQGKRTSLLEQERPNIFTQSVANIGPGETIEVVIRYVQTLPYADGCYKLVFPMVVGPRYIPGEPLIEESGQLPAGRGRLPDTDQVPDASRITPPALAPGQRCGFDIDVRVDIDAGVPIRELRSRAHRIEVQSDGESLASVELARDDRIPNKDFVLEIDVAGDRPEVGVVAHHDGEQGYFVLILQPAEASQSTQIRPRELLCVLDCSGSMDGQPVEIAKRAAERVLTGLRPNDRFNVISFSVQACLFAPEPVPATSANVAAAIAHVRSLQAGGGTEMITGVHAALSSPPPEGYLRIITFFTDGYIGNETAIIGAVQRLLGPARLFAFGVGSSVNRYLLDRMAEVGRGSTQYILLNNPPEDAVDRFAERISKPNLTDIGIDWAGLDAHDLIPSRVPDVFAGVPVYVYGRYDEPGEAVIEVVGRVGTQPRAARVHVVLPGPDDEQSPLPSIWARQRIRQLELAKLGSSYVAAAEEQITELALKYSLMSAYTSFVAVDETPSPHSDGAPEYVPVSVPMPEGVKYETTINQGARCRPRGCFGGGPIGPLGAAIVGVLAIVEWRRRKVGRCVPKR